MNRTERLRALMAVIEEEAERNPAFAGRLDAVLCGSETLEAPPPVQAKPTRGRARRAGEAVIDPIALAREGEPALRAALESLSVPQMKDVLREYALDPSNRLARRKKAELFVEHIVEASLLRAQKGDGFRA